MIWRNERAVPVAVLPFCPPAGWARLELDAPDSADLARARSRAARSGAAGCRTTRYRATWLDRRYHRRGRRLGTYSGATDGPDAVA